MRDFGRTHRTGQVAPPVYLLVSTELGGEKRFSATIARRLANMGALTKGDRRAEKAGNLDKYNLESKMKRAALNVVYTWWIDGGNGKFSGQVLIGSTTKIEDASDYFTTGSICRKLPAPSIFHPELLEPENAGKPRPRNSAERAATSCPELIRLGEQSLNINSRVAVEIGEMLAALLLTNSLRRFASYFDLESGTSRSLYCTPETIEKALIEAARNVSLPEKRKRKNSNGTAPTADFYAR